MSDSEIHNSFMTLRFWILTDPMLANLTPVGNWSGVVKRLSRPTTVQMAGENTWLFIKYEGITTKIKDIPADNKRLANISWEIKASWRRYAIIARVIYIHVFRFWVKKTYCNFKPKTNSDYSVVTIQKCYKNNTIPKKICVSPCLSKPCSNNTNTPIRQEMKKDSKVYFSINFDKTVLSRGRTCLHTFFVCFRYQRQGQDSFQTIWSFIEIK
jgi:hypothetical protein